jgi:hypothetical protein
MAAFGLVGSVVAALAADAPPWPPMLPVYDHIVIVVEENKDFEQILGRRFEAPYIKDTLAREGAVFERMFAEEHPSQGNYFWLFSGSNQNVGFCNEVPSANNRPDYPLTTSSLGEQLSFHSCIELVYLITCLWS